MKLHLNNFLTGALVIIAITSSAQSAIQPSAKIIAHLKQFRIDYATRMQNGKPEQLKSYYADSIRLMPPFQKTIIGKENAVGYQNAILKRFNIHELSRTEREVLDIGGQIIETGTFRMRVAPKSGGPEQILSGKYLNLWIVSANETLWLLTDAWNFDQYYGDFHNQSRCEEVPSVHAAFLPNVPIGSNISFELAALNRLLDATVTQHDAATWMLFYADDAILMASSSPSHVGSKAIEEYLISHTKELPVFQELDIRNDRIDNLGTYVIEYASHIASWKNGSSTGVSLGKNIRVWRREPDHSLKLFRSIGAYD